MSKTNTTIEAKTLKGFRDLLPRQAETKLVMLEKLRAIFLTYGFQAIETPHLEYTDTLIGETGGEIGKQLFRFKDQGERDVCLRFDLTVPFARYVVQHKNELTFPFKRYAYGNCFRGENPQQGRYREFTQCDFDIVGTESVVADAEIIELIIAGLKTLESPAFKVLINSRKILTGLAEILSLKDNSIELIRIIDKFDKIGKEKVLEQINSELKISAEAQKTLASYLEVCEMEDNQFKELRKLFSNNNLASSGLNDLEAAFNILSTNIKNKNSYQLDLTIARGFGYYTGLVFEAKLDDYKSLGSVCSGGRYDDLTKSFSKDNLPGVGASFGLDRILAAYELSQVDLNLVTASKVLVTNLEGIDIAEISKIASDLRTSGVATEVYFESSKLKKQLQYAEKKGINNVLIYGEEEKAKKIYALKNLEKKEQREYNDLKQIVELLRISSYN